MALNSIDMDFLSSYILKNIRSILISLKEGKIEQNSQIDTELIHAIHKCYEMLALYEDKFTDKEKEAITLADLFFSYFIKSYSTTQDKDDCCVCFEPTEFISLCCRKNLCRDCLKSLKTNECPNCRHHMGDIDYDIV